MGTAAPCVIIIAGPNGAGKTTFAREFLPQEADCPVFINADLIAAGLSPFAPERAAIQAGRLMLQSVARHFAGRHSFALETTLSGLGYARQIPQWRQMGFSVDLIFLGLATADMAVQRVAERVRQGGHHIPEATIRRRFDSGKRLFLRVYQPLVDGWTLYDNSGDQPVLLDSCRKAMPPSHQVNEPQPAYGHQTHGNLPADPQGSLAALRRAAGRARQVALQTGTDLIVYRNGQVVRAKPQDNAAAQPVAQHDCA